jgi:hypothetical protein
MGYRLAMVQKLMESFDVNAALLACFPEFDPITLTVQTTFGDVDEQLDSVKANLRFNQGWTAGLEEEDGERDARVSHRKALAMTLRDRIKDVGDAVCSGPSHQLDFLHSTGDSTNNLEATICQHTLQEKALKNIELEDKNYHLENDLHETQGKMVSILAQNQLLQEQLLAFNQGPSPPVFPMAPNNEASDKEDVPMSIHGGGVSSHSQVPFWCDNSILLVATSASLTEPALLFVDNTNRPGSNIPWERGDLLVVIGMSNQAKEGPVQTPTSPGLASHALLQLGEVHLPYPLGSGIHEGSDYSCPGRITANDMIHPIPFLGSTRQPRSRCFALFGGQS